VQLLVTCLVDSFFPDVGFSVVAVLERLGLQVEVPAGQTCCGQPAFNSGSWNDARAMARHLIDVFGDSDVATNTLLGFQGNKDLFLNSVAWLAQDADLISIRPKEPDDQRLLLTRNQQQNMLVLALLLIPGVFIVMGIREWWSRR